MNEWMNEWINEWMNEWMYEWMNKWMNNWAYVPLFWYETCIHAQFFFLTIYIFNKYKSNSLYPVSHISITFWMLWCPDRAISHFRSLKSRSFASFFVVLHFRTFAVSQRPFVVSHHPFVVSQSRTSAHSLFRIRCFALPFRSFTSPFRGFAWPFCCFAFSLFRSLVILHRPFVVVLLLRWVLCAFLGPLRFY